MEMVVYREFSDGSEEIGTMTIEGNHCWVNVGDFDYCISMWGYLSSEFPFIILGTL